LGRARLQQVYRADRSVANYVCVTHRDTLFTNCAGSDTQFMARCGARNITPPHHLCRNPVAREGDRCGKHPGLPRGGPRPTSSSRRAPGRSSSSGSSFTPSRSGHPSSSHRSSWNYQRGMAAPSAPQSPRQPRTTPRQATPRQRPAQQAATPRRRRPDNLTSSEQDRVDRAVEFCADVVTDEWRDAVAGRAADCLTPRTWNRLFRGRRRRDCNLTSVTRVRVGGPQVADLW
jgi:hypothetical protein